MRGGAARADGWGAPQQWLEAAAGTFARHGIEPLALRCRRLLAGPPPSRWSRLGVTDREADVLRLVAEGISNKEIASRLHLSPRTVEKHIENLLRKTGSVPNPARGHRRAGVRVSGRDGIVTVKDLTAVT